MSRFKVQLENGSRTWNLNAELRRILKPIAAEFGWTVEEFLARYSKGGLPGQVPTKRLCEEDDVESPAEFANDPFASDPEIWKRIERAANFYEQDAAQFIWGSIWGAVRCAEDDMIVSPSDGRVGAGKWEINLSVALERRPGESSYEFPGIDINYGVGENAEITLQSSTVLLKREVDGLIGGFGGTEVAVKWRFLDEGTSGLDLSTLPEISFTALQSSVRRG